MANVFRRREEIIGDTTIEKRTTSKSVSQWAIRKSHVFKENRIKIETKTLLAWNDRRDQKMGTTVPDMSFKNKYGT